MTDTPIRVHVVHYADCVNLTLRYKDPRSGKYLRKSAKTANRKDARKKATLWEAELNSGKSQANGSLAWKDFRARYEREVVPGLAVKTGDKIAAVFNVMEAALPVVANGRLRDLTADRLSELQRSLRAKGRAESTIAGHLAHLRASLSWAVDVDIIPAVPKVRRPRRAKNSGGSAPMKGRPPIGSPLSRRTSSNRPFFSP